MKILQINVSNGGSTGAIANSLHKRLLRDGDESRFLYARGPKTAEPTVTAEPTAPTQSVQSVRERYVNAFLSRVSGRVGCFGKKATDRIIAQIEAFSSDVVHLHNLHGYYADVFRLLSFLKERKITTVITLHDEFLFTGRCAFSGNCEKWRVNGLGEANISGLANSPDTADNFGMATGLGVVQGSGTIDSPGAVNGSGSTGRMSPCSTGRMSPQINGTNAPGTTGLRGASVLGCGNCPRMDEYPAALLDKSGELWNLKKQVFSNFETVTVVSPSRWLANRAKESLLQECPIFVVPNGIELDVFSPGESAVRDEYEIKEKHVVLAAAQNIMSGRKGGEYVLKLAETMPNTRFLIVGAEKEVLCPPNVTLIPRKQSREEMAELYRGSDVFLITSREDNFPTVCLEAAACGTPVAGFASGGTPETVSPEASRFVPFGDIPALKTAVEELFLLNEKEQNAKLFTSTAEEMYQAYRRIYLLK